MTIEEKISIVEECMDVDEGTLKLDDLLTDYEEWDSVTALSLIAAIDENFHKNISGGDLKSAKTIRDIINMME